MLTVEHIESEPREYEPPQIVDYGDLVDLTAANGDGCELDADFPAGTKRSALTFSGTC